MELKIKRFSDFSCEELYAVLQVRNAVFICEQQCPYQDIDDKDQTSIHVMLTEGKEIYAYLRIVCEEKKVMIGRVLTTQRGKGYAQIVLKEAIQFIQKNLSASNIEIEAQTYVQSLYEKFGFKAISEPFLLDNIWHVRMLLEL